VERNGAVDIMPDSCEVNELRCGDVDEEVRPPSQDSCEDRQAVLRASLLGDTDDDFELFAMPGEVGKKLSTVHENIEMIGI